jgi:hypothetical protein
MKALKALVHDFRLIKNVLRLNETIGYSPLPCVCCGNVSCTTERAYGTEADSCDGAEDW